MNSFQAFRRARTSPGSSRQAGRQRWYAPHPSLSRTAHPHDAQEHGPRPQAELSRGATRRARNPCRVRRRAVRCICSAARPATITGSLARGFSRRKLEARSSREWLPGLESADECSAGAGAVSAATSEGGGRLPRNFLMSRLTLEARGLSFCPNTHTQVRQVGTFTLSPTGAVAASRDRRWCVRVRPSTRLAARLRETDRTYAIL